MIFEREETPTIMEGRVVRWKGKVPWANYPEISASRNGVLISGAWPVVTDVESIISQLNEALREYGQLARTRR